jgi:hypothetical protein
MPLLGASIATVALRMARHNLDRECAPYRVDVKKDGSQRVWQPCFYEHCLRDESDFQKHLNYIVTPANESRVAMTFTVI